MTEPDECYEDAIVPFWIESNQPEPPVVFARLYLDRVAGRDRVEPAWRRWRAIADQSLTPLLGPVPPEPYVDADPTPVMPVGRLERIEPTGVGVLSALRVTVEWFDGDGQAVLHVSATLGADTSRLNEVVEAAYDVLRDVAVSAEPAYGEVTVGRTGHLHRTALDIALSRSVQESARAARSVLRGYEWATVCPAELAPHVAVAAFDRVVPLARGGVLLRATSSYDEWSAGAVQRVFEALAPILPAGMPQRSHYGDLRRVVFADAADVRGGKSIIAPASAPPADLTEFIHEAVLQGWITTEPVDESAPSAVRELLPPELGVGLTEEGQRRLIELFGLDLRG
ncbi:hypothetical protein ACWT_3378 [Actinoplanes sp. SE50]|uniref:hypothetical protein n=1 Tax=unclassified Actinoplanes TaxID=2626549 RepID=UPI00023ED22B|nr:MULTISPECIES: hypothetical protein [unclassified Actinoplanes]AEV84401.1 hypothetical protein ACPL_3506 [Actinoplanes sp. SE50/110]ATO82793.1 hypothetical protein ACWT_3378 [Actinoplanes sp. SE50]SLM00201.1 hypothetical protein ACSP50_3433 [Actinoplanes sp. SE50/110]